MLLYRSIWEEDRPQLLSVGESAVFEWLVEKGVAIDGLPETELRGQFTDSRFGTANFVLNTQRAEGGGVQALRVRFSEDWAEEGQDWTTICTVLTTDKPGGTFWIDVERLSADPFTRVPFKAPLLVRALIEDGKDPRVGHVRLAPGPLAIVASSLCGLVRNKERRIPLVVFAHDRAGAALTIARAQAAYIRLAGVAQVFVLSPTEVEAFKVAIGEELAVWGGGARLYLPVDVPGGMRPERHRYVPGARAARFEAAAAEIFVDLLAMSVPATPPPREFESVQRALSGLNVSDDLEVYAAVAQAEADEKDTTIQELWKRLQVEEYSKLDLEIENEDLTKEINRVVGGFARRGGLSGLVDELDPSFALPDTVATVDEAIENARRLNGVAIHPDSVRDIEKIETATNATAWANSIWRGFRALDAYASSKGAVAGGFWEWCVAAPSLWTWPATSKKLAMCESEGVMNDKRLRGARMLPVSSEVAVSGRVEMFAHLKIAEGGGPLAPRIYFYDDVRGKTGKIHIGYIGPHENMPNLGAN